uniref:AlNc14C3G386 protein n=1 Tax=Albugo laibachii Nc14 TaxID=890382 RepID=F0VZQ7_9STRA|nr:AlNc14C3G386 [Albugo laibachii Nc14]|eukprot:CCA14278.1 AlNc14C3G386 [Albugo laibachii Nc14]
MSGRPYARHDDGSRGSATDIIAMHPHSFQIRLCPSERSRSVLIRRIMARRRRKETNWRKLLIMRHTKSGAELSLSSDQCTKTYMKENMEIKVENFRNIADHTEVKLYDNENDKLQERLAFLKDQLEKLTQEKHRKFAELKEILVEEAKSKKKRTEGNSFHTNNSAMLTKDGIQSLNN